jgi:D-alanyl-D-alanine carboxypeptidase (penicillin-binding protein 5/6)
LKRIKPGFYNPPGGPSAEFTGGSILGGKTGYTSEAGLCLASLAEKNGKEYILITAGAEGDHTTEQYNISDAFFVYSCLE